MHELDDLRARELGKLLSARVDGGYRGTAGERHPEPFGDARHRRRSAHRHAVTVAARDRAFDLLPLVERYPTRAQLLVVAPAVGARAELPAAPMAVEHRPAGDHDRRDVRARRPHQRAGHRLVATGEEHDAVERITADRLLDVHRHEVAVEHRRRLHQRLARGHHRELEREPTGLQHAALHRLGEVAQVRVAVDELAPAVADPDHRPAAERLVRDTRRLQPRPVEEAVEVAAVEPLARAPPVRTVVAIVPHRRHSVLPCRWLIGLQPVFAALEARYSAATRSVSSSTEVSFVGLSKVIRPCWSRFTRSQISTMWM